MRYQCIADHSDAYSVGVWCEALGVSPSGYYRWKSTFSSARRQEETQLKESIAAISREAKGRYGYRPMYHHLQSQCVSCGRDRTLRLMREMGLSCRRVKRFKPVGTDSNHGYGYAPNLLKERESPTAINQVWTSDVTYVPTEEGWRYLATVMDLYSRHIIGWSVGEKNDTDLACRALHNAIAHRGVDLRGLIHHSDRGSTYASYRYQKILSHNRIKASMSAKGNCYDNAAMESFFGRFKTSTIKNTVYKNTAQLRDVVFEYIEISYNRFRKHAALGYLAPVEFEVKYSAE